MNQPKTPINSPSSYRDEDPVHLLGCIQPHGILLVIQESDLRIIQASQNTTEKLGIPTEKLLGKNLKDLLPKLQLETIIAHLSANNLKAINPLEITLKIKKKTVLFLGYIHSLEQVLLLELEEYDPQQEISLLDFYKATEVSISKIKSGLSLEEVCQISAQEIRKITQFDRVMVYQFDKNWHGQVIAEDNTKYMESYLGLHFPAADIPPLSRHLFSLQTLRFIPDVNHQPVSFMPQNNPITQQPLDLSYLILRGVHPIHIEYLQNMGVGSSMTISLIKNNQLWGLIACHNQTAKFVTKGVRVACELFSKILSLALSEVAETENYKYQLNIKNNHTKLIKCLSKNLDIFQSLVNYSPNLLDLFSCQGAGIYLDGNYQAIGQSPNQEQIQGLVQWLKNNHSQDIFYTNQLPKIYPDAVEYKAIASGILSIYLAKNSLQYIFWFRPEELQTVNWAGSLNQLVEIDEQEKLHPRKSFELWKETVDSCSLPWQNLEIEAALELRKAILEIGFNKLNEFAQSNSELQQKNQDLDAFAYIASHDLKEPLRGIYNYANFLLEDYSDRLDENGVHQVETLVRLSQKMANLLDSLLQYSRLGRIDFFYEDIDLNSLLEQTLDLLRGRIEENQVNLIIPRPLPRINADQARLHDLYINLISNAIKYNDKDHKIVEIGYFNHGEALENFPQTKISELNHPDFIFYVRDNGIGIPTKHQTTIFQIFKRLHSPEKYGGGTGIGLTIAQKIIERHGGNIWLESTLNEGTTFYFTLAR
ncbi:ATP-binding protein [Crocosphaera sp. XPORK-15E]|uniref:ATP-binding protein n=1 Tax=Crocosphaera sp. XPORK-15E TaxID=3110247 RepID=UPI002B1E9B00|nr:ATP-binding protein [Crocosphaera sp. XPORK-15E]MEA5536384.1 ATP-binding protein [Crocosphaera sp. XPORK-15E]